MCLINERVGKNGGNTAEKNSKWLWYNTRERVSPKSGAMGHTRTQGQGPGQEREDTRKEEEIGNACHARSRGTRDESGGKREQAACHHLRYAWSTSLLLSKNAVPIWFTNGLMHFAVGDGIEGTRRDSDVKIRRPELDKLDTRRTRFHRTFCHVHASVSCS